MTTHLKNRIAELRALAADMADANTDPAAIRRALAVMAECMQEERQ